MTTPSPDRKPSPAPRRRPLREPDPESDAVDARRQYRFAFWHVMLFLAAALVSASVGVYPVMTVMFMLCALAQYWRTNALRREHPFLHDPTYETLVALSFTDGKGDKDGKDSGRQDRQ